MIGAGAAREGERERYRDHPPPPLQVALPPLTLAAVASMSSLYKGALSHSSSGRSSRPSRDSGRATS